MLPLHNTVLTQISVSQTRKLLHMTQLKIQISVHIPSNSLTDEKFESYKVNATNHTTKLKLFPEHVYFKLWLYLI